MCVHVKCARGSRVVATFTTNAILCLSLDTRARVTNRTPMSINFG